MGIRQALPDARAARLAGVLLNRHSANEIAEAIEILVDVLDLMGGDPDVEPNGDERDGNAAEDDFCEHNCPLILQGPGCPIADADTAVDDGPCDENTDLEDERDLLHPSYPIDQAKGPEHWEAAHDREIMEPHIERIRRERCRPRRWGGFWLEANARTIATDDN